MIDFCSMLNGWDLFMLCAAWACWGWFGGFGFAYVFLIYMAQRDAERKLDNTTA